MEKEKMVKVRILAHGMQEYAHDEVIEMPLSKAELLCKVTHYDSGGGKIVEHRRAIIESERLAQVAASEADIASMTVAEMEAKGLKNVVSAPDAQVVEKKEVSEPKEVEAHDEEQPEPVQEPQGKGASKNKRL